MAGIKLVNVDKSYDGKNWIIKDLNLEINDEEFVVLVGPSGCGKSTTLRIIAGLEDATDGDVYIGEKRVNDTPPKDRDIAMVFQNYALYPHYTVYKNMAFSLKLKRMDKKEMDERIQAASEILGLKPYLDRKPRALSGGQRQRVALGRALVRQPAVFLLDEPLSNLDAKLRNQMRSEISKLHKRLKTTFVYVTHDQVEAMTMGERICVMNEGRIMQYDKPQVLYDQPANLFVAGFMGTPQMNFIPGVLKKDDSGWSVEEKGHRHLIPEKKYADVDLTPFEDKNVVIGVRPEKLNLAEKDSVGLAGTVDLVELLGAEAQLLVNYNDTLLSARVPVHSNLEIDAPVTLAFDMNDAHLFDQETENAIFN